MSTLRPRWLVSVHTDLSKLLLKVGKTDVDIMSFRYNKLNKFVVKTRDPLAFVVDALVMPSLP